MHIKYVLKMVKKERKPCTVKGNSTISIQEKKITILNTNGHVLRM
jgi:hypothetical protein